MASNPITKTAFPAFRASLWLGLILILSIVNGCGGYDDGLSKFPVTGAVQVDGRPISGVLVRFYRDGAGANSNADTPAGVTNQAGEFALSTNGQDDGAVVGQYKVAFIWPDFNGPGATDQLAGRYGSATTTPFEVTVVEGENRLPTFQLETPPPTSSTPKPRLDENDRPR